MDQYRTVKNEAEDEFVERRSRFIGRVKPVKTEEDAVSFIRACKSKYWDASHNVYAYSLREGSVRRYSDDGEPQGTAGVPVLEVLQKSGVTDLVVVVTRYFGGVLLGRRRPGAGLLPRCEDRLGRGKDHHYGPLPNPQSLSVIITNTGGFCL